MSDVLKVGPDAMRKAMPEVKLATKPHPKGNKGVAQSVLEVNAKILEGAKDPRLREWAGQALKKAGDPEDTRGRAQALLDAMRAQTVYVQDPPGVELVQRATMTLCLEGSRGLCLRAGDCDDLVVVFCAAAMSLGMNVKTVIQAYKGEPVFQHILCSVYDPDSEEWLKVDPSHRTWPVGQASPYATKEKSFDVMDGAKVTLTDHGEFVGVGLLEATTLGPKGLGLAHRVAAGETPAAIAKRYTGDPCRYCELVDANPHKPRLVSTYFANGHDASGGLVDRTTWTALVEGEELALPESWRALGLGEVPSMESMTPTCPRCRSFAWGGFTGWPPKPILARDGLTHHPSCPDAHVRAKCRACGRMMPTGCQCTRPTMVRLVTCTECASRPPPRGDTSAR